MVTEVVSKLWNEVYMEPIPRSWQKIIPKFVLFMVAALMTRAAEAAAAVELVYKLKNTLILMILMLQACLPELTLSLSAAEASSTLDGV